MQSSKVTVTPDKDKHYINEDFILIDKSVEDIVKDGNTRKVRVWKIQRLIIDGDSVMVGEIDNSDANDCNCGIITDELWNKRSVGDILHFDYIRKDRFVKTEPLVYLTHTGEVSFTTPEPIEFKIETPKLINLNKLEIESRILEIDREIMSLERELEMLKESQK